MFPIQALSQELFSDSPLEGWVSDRDGVPRTSSCYLYGIVNDHAALSLHQELKIGLEIMPYNHH